MVSPSGTCAKLLPVGDFDGVRARRRSDLLDPGAVSVVSGGFRRFQACVPAVGCAKRRARPMRAYARAGPSVSLTARTML